MKMSEEISEEELTEKIITICGELEDIGEKALSQKLFKSLSKKITFAEREDWVNEQICSMFPNDIDVRCIAFCCSPRSACPYRAAVLRELGWKMEDYIRVKTEFGEQIKKIITK